MKTIYIYALIDPSTSNVRYIGKTVNLKRRYNRHIRNAQDTTCKYHSANWIRSLLNNNLRPELIVIEETDLDNWIDREIYWIKYYRNIYDLTNILDGGNGTATYGRLGKTNTDEHKMKCSLARKGVSINQSDINGNRRKSVIAYYDKIKISILQYSLNGEFIQEWNSAVEAANMLNLHSSSNIVSCLKYGTNEYMCKGYMWRYKTENYSLNIESYKQKKRTRVVTEETKNKIRNSKLGSKYNKNK